MEQKDLDSIDRPAISLHTASGKHFELPTLLNSLTKQFQQDLAVFIEKGFGPFYPTYKAQSSLSRGDPVIINIYPNKYPGVFESLQSDGALVMRSSDGELHTYFSGEILE